MRGTIDIKYGRQRTVTVAWRNSAGALVDLSTGYTAALNIRQPEGKAFADSAMFAFTDGSGITLLDGTNGTHNIEVAFATADFSGVANSTVDDLVGDLVLTLAAEEVLSLRLYWRLVART